MYQALYEQIVTNMNEQTNERTNERADVVVVPVSEVGYRYYDARGVEPAYPFGHGLSYAQFEYSNVRILDGVEKAGTETGTGDRGPGTGTGDGEGDLYPHLTVNKPPTTTT